MSAVDYDAAVAIIGMAGRFPGAPGVDEFWAELTAGRSGLRELTDEELERAGVSPALRANPAYVRVAGPVDGVDMFDAGLFGLGRREAETMDPQHRLFLETCWEALERAAYPPTDVAERVGVFAGCGFPDYTTGIGQRVAAEPGGALLLATGNERDSLASYVSYKLDLRGPAVTVQSFCSSSLVAVHLAAQSLANFECDAALAGGVFVPLPQDVGYVYEEGGIYAPDGTVRAFDAGARGTVMGSGVGVVLLKRLPDALADGDRIDAVILGSAVNNDGRVRAGYTAPGVDGQADVMARALGFAGVAPETVGYVECHATGTVLGDSIELAALNRAYPGRPERPRVLGSLKPSVGHLDRAAGVAGLIRAALALQHRTLPGTPHYRSPNPTLLAMTDRFTVLTGAQDWPAAEHPRRAGVSAFGFGGTNAHAVLEEPPERTATAPVAGPHLLVLAARGAGVLDEMMARLRSHLVEHPELEIGDVAYTLQRSRARLPWRRSAVCVDRDDALAALADPARWTTGEARQADPPVVLAADPGTPDGWWAGLRDAANRLAGQDEAVDPVGAVAGLFRRLGLTVAAAGASAAATAAGASAAAATGAGAAVRIEVGPQRGASPAAAVLDAVAQAWRAGGTVEWSGLHPVRPHPVLLPTYPFQRRRYWIDPVSVPAHAAPPAGRSDDVTRWTYLPTWRQVPPAGTPDRAELRAAGPWLVCGGDGWGAAVVAHLVAAGAEVTAAAVGEPEAFARLVGGLSAVPRTVLLFAGGAGNGDERVDSEVHLLRALAGAVAQHAPTEPLNILLATREAVGVGDSPPRHPAQAAAAALLPVLAQENPGWLCRHVDLHAGTLGGDPARIAAALVAEVPTDFAGPVALRRYGRWVREYAPMALPPVTAAEPGAGGPVRPGATVLITGGLGHVGLILARHLTLDRGCRVVLTSRTPIPAPERWSDPGSAGDARVAGTVRTLRELTSRGAEIMVVPADVADESQLRAVVDGATARFGSLDLVVHAAGASDPAGFGPAHLVPRKACEALFAAKTGGYRALRRVLTGRDVPGITLSSLSTVLGGLGLGPYAAANAALDADVLADVAGGARWITVDWDAWAAAPGPVPDPASYDMTHQGALDAFARAVALLGRADHLVISTGPLADRYDRWVLDPAAPATADDDGERDPRPDLGMPYVEPAEGTERTLADLWARVLRVEPIGANDDFFALGGTSVLAIDLIARVRAALGLAVPVTALLGFPTVRGLAGQIDEATG